MSSCFMMIFMAGPHLLQVQVEPLVFSRQSHELKVIA